MWPQATCLTQVLTTTSPETSNAPIFGCLHISNPPRWTDAEKRTRIDSCTNRSHVVHHNGGSKNDRDAQDVAIRDAESIRESATKSNQAVHAAQTDGIHGVSQLSQKLSRRREIAKCTWSAHHQGIGDPRSSSASKTPSYISHYHLSW